jgi:hypothetical protein
VLLSFNLGTLTSWNPPGQSRPVTGLLYLLARPTLFYGSETWVTTKRDISRLEAAEMRFLRSVKRYTRLDKIRSEVIGKELEIPGIQDMRSKHKQNWINHLEEWATPDSRNTPSTTIFEEEGIVDAPGNDGNASMPKQVKRPNPWRKKKKKKKKKKMMMPLVITLCHL